MQQQADSVTTTVPTQFTPAVPSHSINNHVPIPVHLRQEREIIVCALAAPNNPDPGPFRAERERRTFWTACASCKKKNKHSIEYLNCNISCVQCSETFKATEVSRPRNQRTTTAEIVHSGAIVTSPCTMVQPSKMTPTVETPFRKKVKREIIATQAAGKHGDNLKGFLEKISKIEINMLLMSKGRSKVIEATVKGNNENK